MSRGLLQGEEVKKVVEVANNSCHQLLYEYCMYSYRIQ